MGLQELTAVSRFYGSSDEYVIAGGGNTSFKDREYLYIKASGTSLATIDESGFVKMDRSKLALIWKKNYSPKSEERETAVLADMMAARCSGEERKRPSVEVQLHDILPFAYVVHTHPTLVNSLTCSQRGEGTVRELFDAIWIPSINPGYTLSLAVKKALDLYRAEKNRDARIILLQNHGAFVAADTIDEIKAVYGQILNVIDERIKRRPDLTRDDTEAPAQVRDLGRALCKLADTAASGGTDCCFEFSRNPEILRLVQDKAAFYPVSSAYTPDHIVYAGSDPLFVEDALLIEGAWQAHIDKTGRPPRIVAVKGLGVFSLGASEKTAHDAMELFLDSVKLAVYTESFGGPCFMERDKIDFINNWEAEHYRSKIAAEK
ncbi:MAG: class II aldolase/adducin family protein [Treponema sp.]|jgi:rhamnose utilization protein RhaD (predicted bifunctional aldolase and dehydrogenase)|nr:class II aldolase/adducin family protein [Treponema sp.]